VGLRLTGGPELVRAGAELGQFVLYDDHPRHWDAWDIDPEYEQKPAPVEFDAAHLQIESFGPLRVKLVRRAALGQRSSIVQEYTLDAGSPRLDVRTTVQWHESHRLLRALFPTTIHAARATYECAYGHIQRSTARRTPHERAAFEVPAHRWTDLSSDHAPTGLAVLNDCKYGCSCDGALLGLSLLRAPKFPDPACDMGVHVFTYSMMPHSGDWRAAGVDDQAELLNSPLRSWALPAGQAGDLGPNWAPIRIETQGAHASVAAFKIAEEDDRLILRLVETRGRAGRVHIRWHLPVTDVRATDLHEQPIENDTLSHDPGAGVTTLALAPFRIVTLAAGRA
jgi:alpha-mannosidase